MLHDRIKVGASVLFLGDHKKQLYQGIAETCEVEPGSSRKYWIIRPLIIKESTQKTWRVPQESVSQARWKGGGVGSVLRCAAEIGNIEIAELLLRLGIPVFTADALWNTPLIVAVKAKQTKMIELLLQHKASQDLFNKRRANAYDFAIASQDNTVLRALHIMDVDKDQVLREERTQLIVAAQDDDDDRIGNILFNKTQQEAKAEIDKVTAAHGLSPLMISAREGKLRACQKLLELHANAELRTTTGTVTALHFAAANRRMDIVQLLAESDRGQSLLNLKTSSDETALFSAARSGSSEVVNVLILRKADLFLRNTKDQTALMVASRHGHVEVMRALIDAGADVRDRIEKDQNTALMLAARFGHHEAIKLLVESLPQDTDDYSRFDDIDMGDIHEYTALMRSAGHGHEKVTIELLKHISKYGSGKLLLSLTKANKDGITVLMNAARNGNAITIAQLLREIPPHMVRDIIDAKDTLGETALFMAAQDGHMEALRSLLQQDATVDVVRKSDGMTPLLVACINGRHEAARTLILAKADVNHQRTTDMMTGLMLAVQNRFEKTVRVLLQSPQIDVYRQAEKGDFSKKGDTALILAMEEQEKSGNTDGLVGLLKDQRTVLFQSMQQTTKINEHMHTWLEGRMPESVKASLPPFNVRSLGDKLQLRTAAAPTGVLNVPVFGFQIPQAIMGLFNQESIVELAKELRVSIPQYSLQKLIQSKMWKVMELVSVARDREDCSTPPNSEAVDKLEYFVAAFTKLKPESVPDQKAWKGFVESHVQPGWEDKLHFDQLLSNFGFTDMVANSLRNHTYVDMSNMSNGGGEEVSLEQFSFRWLSKAFAAYSVRGCLTDVANLVYSMAKREQPKPGVKESEVAAVIREVGEKILSGNFTDLWIPTHFAQDAETDDMLSWLLLEHVHKKLRTELQVLVQLPDQQDFDCLGDYLSNLTMTKGRLKIFRDSESKNQMALCDVFKPTFPQLGHAAKKYEKK